MKHNEKIAIAIAFICVFVYGWQSVQYRRLADRYTEFAWEIEENNTIYTAIYDGSNSLSGVYCGRYYVVPKSREILLKYYDLSGNEVLFEEEK